MVSQILAFMLIWNSASISLSPSGCDAELPTPLLTGCWLTELLQRTGSTYIGLYGRSTKRPCLESGSSSQRSPSVLPSARRSSRTCLATGSSAGAGAGSAGEAAAAGVPRPAARS